MQVYRFFSFLLSLRTHSFAYKFLSLLILKMDIAEKFLHYLSSVCGDLFIVLFQIHLFLSIPRGHLMLLANSDERSGKTF
jgi:AAA+ ATPase superfamily predicted ATPase